MPDSTLRLLGLAARAGAVVAGTERVRQAVRGGEARFVLVAGDISENTRDKLIPLLTTRGVSHAEVFDRNRLGAAIGKSAMSAVAVLDASFAKRFRELTAGQTETE